MNVHNQHRLNDRWRLEPVRLRLVFDPIKWWMRFVPWPRTAINELWRDLGRWAGTSVGIAFALPLDHDNTWGIEDAPRKMWLTEGATIDHGKLPIWLRLKATNKAPQRTVLISGPTEDAHVLIRPWMSREILWRRFLVAAAILSFVADLLGLTSFFFG